MKSDNIVGRIYGKLKNTVLSRLLITYIAIMGVMLATQSLLMGGIYQQQYTAERIRALQKEVTDLSITASEESTYGSLGPIFPKVVQAVAKRQNAVIWVVNRLGDVKQMSPVADTAGSSGDTVPQFKSVVVSGDDFQEAFRKVIHGETVTEVGFFSGQLGGEMLTIGVPIRLLDATGHMQDYTIGALFIHSNLKEMNTSIGKMYGHIATSALVAMILGIVLISLTSTRISRPLVQMNGIARRIARGDFGTKAEVRSRDEIGQLAQSFNTMAEELQKQEELRSGFVANVSHELRSPLTSIHGFAQGMLDGTISQTDHQKYLEVIVGETRRLNKLIRELLDLSQIESGKFPLNLQAFDINELISRVLITFEEKIESKKLEIEVDFRQEKAMVLADPDRIEQVLINLLDNAVKFTGEGGRIRIWTHSASDKMLIGIGDNGPGIPEEDQPYVWERFYKVDKSHTGKKGTGLGLSIVKKIMDQHGERITLQSQPGGGAVFAFSLRKPDKPERNSSQGE